MAQKYLKGIVPEVDPQIEAELAPGLESDAMKAVAAYEKEMAEFAFNRALQATWEFIGRMNKYIDVMAPWELAKKASSRKQLEAVIYNLLEGLRVVAGLIYPIMPNSAGTMQKHLGLDPDAAFYALDKLKTWRTISPGTQLLKTISLFPRIDVKKDASRAPAAEEQTDRPEITIEEFAKVDLRVATVVKAEAVPRAKKLLQLEIDLGQKKTIVAGIAASYPPEELVGKQIIVVANLKPAKIMGILSNGMLLAAVDKKRTTLATLDGKVKPGTALR